MTVAFAKPAILNRLGAGPCVIEASAGTGKTYTLEHLVVDLVLQGVPLDQILVVTFTAKATLELKARVRAKLETMVAGLEQPDTVAPCPAGEPRWEVDEAGGLLLREALARFDRATLSTIHGFCQQVLGDAAFEGGRLFQQEIVSSDEAFDRAFKTLIRTRFARTGADRLLFERALQLLNGVEGLGRLLKAAMKERANLDLPEAEPLRAALEAFPEAAAQAFLEEMRDYEAIKEAAKRPRGPQLKALGAAKVSGNSYPGLRDKLGRVLRGLAAFRAGGIPGLFWAETDPTELAALESGFGKGQADPQCAALAAACADLGSRACDFRAVLVAAFLPPLAEELERFKEEEGLFDFDDMILLVQRAVLAPEGETLVRRLRERFRVALIDEFQDTDGLQWDIFRKLFLEDGEHRLILVGDPKQAIYGFRSGDLPTYLAAVAAVRAATGREPEVLTTNYRSTPDMLESHGEIFQDAGAAPFFTGRNAGQFKPVACGRPELRLRDGQGRPLAPIRLVAAEAGTGAATRRQLAAGLAQAIRDTLRASGPRFGAEGPGAGLRPEDVMVLTSNAREGQEMARALKALAVPCAFFKQDGLFGTPEAAAVRDLLLAIDVPLDDSRRAKVLLGPFFGLTFQEAEACRELPDGHPILARLFSWRELALAGRFGEFFARLAAESGITQRLLFLEEGERALTNLQHLLELLQREALAGCRTLLELAVLVQRWIDGRERPAVEDGDTQRLEREAGAVQILTMHKSKGLEAPVVAVFGGFSRGGALEPVHRYHDGQDRRRAWVGSLAAAPEPVRAWVEAERTEEYERLLYVALTRAKAQLILPRIVLGAKPPTFASPFDPASGDPKGPYGCVNRRLRTLLAGPERPARFLVDGPEPEADPAPDLAAVLAAWRPVLPEPAPLPDFPALARSARPFWMFSYSSLHHGLQGLAPLARDWEERTGPEEGDGPGPLGRDAQGPGGGARLGTLVHALLQRVPLESFDGRPLAEWLAAPEIAVLFQEGLPAAVRPAVAGWIHQAMTLPLALPGGGTVVLSRVERMLRELDFLTPFPGRDDFLDGAMDLLFQWQGKAYVLDWKTNRLESYGPDGLGDAMAESYLLQVKVYTVAVCRFLEIASAEDFQARFGGVVYVFLRGLPEGGVWNLSPSWAEVRAWERELAELPVERLVPVQAGGAER